MKEEFFILMKFNISNFPFMSCIFGIRFLFSFFLSVLDVYVLLVSPWSVLRYLLCKTWDWCWLCCLPVDVHLLQLQLPEAQLHPFNYFYVFVENQVGFLYDSLSGLSNPFYGFCVCPSAKTTLSKYVKS